jgi:hypothetical protein
MPKLLALNPLVDQAVQPLQLSDARLAHFPSRKKRIRISIGVAALIAYACCWLAGSWAYSNYSQIAARSLPAKCDVLMAGSSVINAPLMMFEFPGKDCSLLADRRPVVETRRLEWLLSNHGAHLRVFGGAAFGQSIEETADFVHGVTSLNKRPRLLLLFVAPIVILGSHNIKYYGLLPPDVVQSLQLWQRRFEEFHLRLIIKIKLLAAFVYGRTTLPERRSVRWQRVEDSYKRFYRSDLSTDRLESVRRIVNMCRDHSIPLVVVSTPLDPSNRANLSQFSYADYHQALQELFTPAKGESGAPRNVRFVDLGEDARFLQKEDFDDGAHLNAKGGKKMFELLAPIIVDTVRAKNF